MADMSSGGSAKDSTLYFVVDVSAITKGLGNIRKWLETSTTDALLFIPSYTIHELDYLKKGISMTAINAREGMRLIEKVVSNEDVDVACRVMIETPKEVGPKWKDCMKYKTRAPRVNEFKPHHSTPTIPVTMSETEAVELTVHAEPTSEGDDQSERAEMPARLRFLLRPLIRKVHIERQNWIFVTEDNSTRIWAESFRVPCINVSEADSLLFHTNHWDSAIPRFTQLSNSESPINQNQLSNQGKKKRIRKKKGNENVSTLPIVSKSGPRGSHEVKLENFDDMDFVSRGKGDLWVP